MRAGTYALSLLSVPLNVHVLGALGKEPRSLVDLRRVAGSPPQTTMRSHLRTLTELQVLERRRQNEFPGSVDYELGSAGRELLGVAETLQAWLNRSPEEPLSLGSPAAKSVIKALVEGWSSTIIRAIASRPLSLTDLNKLISSLNYPSLERRLSALRLAGLIEPVPGGGRGTPYVASPWLRAAIAPLTAAARWERNSVRTEAAPVARLDIEAAFLLAVPAVALPADLSGTARLAVELPSAGGELGLAGVMAAVKEGRILSCATRLQGHADAWASGSAGAWLRALIENDTESLELGGDCALGLGILDGLHGDLFGVREGGGGRLS